MGKVTMLTHDVKVRMFEKENTLTIFQIEDAREYDYHVGVLHNGKNDMQNASEVLVTYLKEGYIGLKEKYAFVVQMDESEMYEVNYHA